MARDNSFKGLSGRVKSLQSQVISGSERLIERFSIFTYSSIIFRSPVDTGRYRSNNFLEFSNNGETRAIEDENFLINQAANTVSKYKSGNTVFLFNNLPYAAVIEVGNHSAQAPKGVYSLALQEARQTIKSFSILTS